MDNIGRSLGQHKHLGFNQHIYRVQEDFDPEKNIGFEPVLPVEQLHRKFLGRVGGLGSIFLCLNYVCRYSIHG